MRSLTCVVTFVVIACTAFARPVVLDDFAEPGRWEVIEAEGVELELSVVPGVAGDALQLEYDFTTGAGFCIIRREVDLRLPANYRFDFAARGSGPANNLEFKLLSVSGDDVWWNNRRAFEPPADWTALRNRARHFEFAWGPSGGTPLERVGAIEFAIASSEGGSGVIELDELTFEVLPDADPEPVGGCARVGGAGMPMIEIGEVADDGTVAWDDDLVPEPADATAIEIAFDHPVEFGSIEIEWDAQRPPGRYEIRTSDDGETWRTIHTVGPGRGGAHAFFLPEREAEVVRVFMPDGLAGRFPTRFRLVPIGEVPDANTFWAARARAERRGVFPAYFLGERAAWTVVGLPGESHEALVSEYGAVEPVKAGGTIEPFLFLGNGGGDARLVTWADAEVTRSLDGGFRPIPTVSWRVGSVGLDITALATGEPGASRLLVRYRVTNHGPGRGEAVGLELASRPFQVQPSYQTLNLVGGETGAGALLPGGDDHGRRVSVADEVGLFQDPDAPFTSTSMHAMSVPPGGSRQVVLEVSPRPGAAVVQTNNAAFETALRIERERWDRLLGSPVMTVPESARRLVDSLRTAIAHILINQDGPAIQPGSRTYERSWIRDGSVTSLALIHAGLAGEARDYIDWYAGYQFESGKVPCVVDHRGPDPVDEHDSTGEFIFALRNAAIAAGDPGHQLALLRRHYGGVVRGVGYMESLRAQRLTDMYTRSDDPVTRACAGLMPESISHEGYSAKPMHSYWDDFWALRGYLDAADIARRLGEDEDAERFAEIARRFRQDIYDSIRLAAAHHGIGYVPGCVELGDFDATSTSIAVFPVGELGRAPEPLLTNTFEKYWEFFVNRRDGVEPWDGMTPYECRIIGAFVRLGWSERAHELMDWLLGLQSPTGWNQWGEIAYADPSPGRFVGDMPHTWVASGYVLSLLSMFAYERGDEIVLAPAIPRAWLSSSEGVGVEGMWTRWGPLSYRFRAEDGTARLELLETPSAPGGLVLRVPEGASVHIDGAPRETMDGVVRLGAGDSSVVFRVP